jgi:hypothetical protein
VHSALAQPSRPTSSLSLACRLLPGRAPVLRSPGDTATHRRPPTEQEAEGDKGEAEPFPLASPSFSLLSLVRSTSFPPQIHVRPSAAVASPLLCRGHRRLRARRSCLQASPWSAPSPGGPSWSWEGLQSRILPVPFRFDHRRIPATSTTSAATKPSRAFHEPLGEHRHGSPLSPPRFAATGAAADDGRTVLRREASRRCPSYCRGRPSTQTGSAPPHEPNARTRVPPRALPRRFLAPPESTAAGVDVALDSGRFSPRHRRRSMRYRTLVRTLQEPRQMMHRGCFPTLASVRPPRASSSELLRWLC